jgi:hypothetical protein
MAARKASVQDPLPATVLETLSQQAVAVARKARKHAKNLRGDNFYGNKLAELRADATNAFRQLASRSAGDSSALAELVEIVFSPDTHHPKRIDANRELVVALRTTWHQEAVPATTITDTSGDLFPLSILSEAKRGYLVTVGRQMNGCYRSGWFDSSAVMMRRLVEISIIEAFEANGLAAKITGGDGNYVQLSDLITAALAEPSWTLSRNSKKYLPQLRDLGHQSAHGRYYTARRDDIERIQPGCRVVIEEFLHHAGLL